MRNIVVTIVMALVLICSQSAIAAEWKLLAQHRIEKYYIDLDSIKPHQQYSVGMYEYSVKIVRDVDLEKMVYAITKGDNEYTALVYKRNILDCKTMDNAYIHFVAYNKSGEILHEFKYDVMAYGPAIGDDAIASRFACDKIKQSK